MVFSIPSTNLTPLTLPWTSVTDYNWISAEQVNYARTRDLLKSGLCQHRATASQPKCERYICCFLLIIELHYQFFPLIETFKLWRKRDHVANIVKCLCEMGPAVLWRRKIKIAMYISPIPNRMLTAREYFCIWYSAKKQFTSIGSFVWVAKSRYQLLSTRRSSLSGTPSLFLTEKILKPKTFQVASC